MLSHALSFDRFQMIFAKKRASYNENCRLDVRFVSLDHEVLFQ
jgi:hypothetical protein